MQRITNTNLALLLVAGATLAAGCSSGPDAAATAEAMDRFNLETAKANDAIDQTVNALKALVQQVRKDFEYAKLAGFETPRARARSSPQSSALPETPTSAIGERTARYLSNMAFCRSRSCETRYRVCFSAVKSPTRTAAST